MARRGNLMVRILAWLLRPVVEQILATRPPCKIGVHIVDRGERVMPPGLFDRVLEREYGVARAPGLRS